MTEGGSGMTLIRHSAKVGIHACLHRRYRNQRHLAPGNVSGIAGMSAPDFRLYTACQGRVFTSTQSIKYTSAPMVRLAQRQFTAGVAFTPSGRYRQRVGKAV